MRTFPALLLGPLIVIVAAPLPGVPPTAPPPITLVDASKNGATFTWAQISAGNSFVSYWNSGPGTQDLTAHLTSFNRGPAGGPRQAEPLTLALSPPSLKIDAQSAGRFLLKPGAVPIAGSFTGFLVVEYAKNKFPPIISQIRITVPSPTLLLPKFTASFRRWVPFTHWFRSTTVSIPMKTGAFADIRNGQLVGAVRNDSGAWRAVRLDPERSSPAAVSLTVDPPPSAGKYDGDLSWGDEHKTALSLTVLVQDYIWWPIAVMVVGTWLAFFVKRYLGVRRLTLSLREREAEIGQAYQKAQQQFAAVAAGKPFGTYSIADDLATQRVALLGVIAKIEKLKFAITVDSNPDYKDAQTKLQAINAGLAAWGALGSQLDALASALEALQESVGGDTAHSLPDFFTPNSKLLTGGRVDLADLDGLRQRVTTATALSSQWTAAKKQVEQAQTDFNQLPDKLTADQSKQKTCIEQQLAALWFHLKAVKTPADLDALLTTRGDLDKVTVALAQLHDSLSHPALPKIVMRDFTFLMPVGDETTNISDLTRGSSELSDPAANDDRRAERLKRAITRGDVISGLFAGGVALLTGLNAYYIGQPFGTLKDYITVFLWAAGTKVALDMLTAVFDKLALPVLPPAK